MASVRLTDSLKSEILDTIDAKFRTVTQAYRIPEGVDERLRKFGNDALDKDEARVTEAVDAMAAATVKAFGLTTEDDIEKARQRARNAIQTSHWGGLNIRLYGDVSYVDPYDETGEAKVRDTELHTVQVKRVSNSRGGDTHMSYYIGNGLQCRDPELVALVQPVIQNRINNEQKRKDTRTKVRDLLSKVTTLKKLLDVAPNLRDVIPAWALEKMEEKVTRTATKAEPVEIPTFDDDVADELSTVALQADALSALNGH